MSLELAAPTSSSGKRAFVHQLFTRIAPRYDTFNRLASFGLDQRWRDQAVEASGVRPGMVVLDVCSGTGDLALLCAAKVGANGLVIGVDFNEQMLRGTAAKRPTQSQRASVQWLRGDALCLPFASGTFDRLFIGFSTRNLSDLKQGITEMTRVLKPNGQLVILETGRPSSSLVRFGYWCFLHTVVRGIGWVLTGAVWPFTYLARSVKAFVTPTQFVELLQSCGTRARYIPLSSGLASLYIAMKSA